MLAFGSSNDLHWQRFWADLQNNVETYHVRTPEDEWNFRPGELAHAKGVVVTTFYKFLLSRGYALNEFERSHYQLSQRKIASFGGKVAKPCIVLGRLGDGKYRVCLMSSFGGNIRPDQILSPLMRYFGYSMSRGEWPPGEPLLETSPRFNKTSYAIMIPFLTKDVSPLAVTQGGVRAFLKVGHLERLERLMKKRLDGFDKVADYIRKGDLAMREQLSSPRKHWSREMKTIFDKKTSTRFEPHPVAYRLKPNPLPGIHTYRVHGKGLDSDMPSSPIDFKPPKLRVPEPHFVKHLYKQIYTDVVLSEIPIPMQRPDLRKADAQKLAVDAKKLAATAVKATRRLLLT